MNEWKQESPDPDFITQCMFQSIATSFSEHSVAKGGNVLGLENETDNVVMLLYDIAVKTPELEVLAREKLQASIEAMKEYAASLEGLVDWAYLNYADGTQVRNISFTYDVRGSRSAESIRKLRRGKCSQDSCSRGEVRSKADLSSSRARRIQDLKG